MTHQHREVVADALLEMRQRAADKRKHGTHYATSEANGYDMAANLLEKRLAAISATQPGASAGVEERDYDMEDRGAAALYAHCRPDAEVEWDDLNDYEADKFRDEAQAVIAAALRTPSETDGDVVADSLRATLEKRNYRTDGDVKALLARIESMALEDRDCINAGRSIIAEYKSRLAKATTPQQEALALGEWIERAAWCAEKILPLLAEVGPAAQSGDGDRLNHFRWMAQELAAKSFTSETKACRWLGYLQCGLVLNCLSDLATEKQRNLDSRSALLATNVGGEAQS